MNADVRSFLRGSGTALWAPKHVIICLHGKTRVGKSRGVEAKGVASCGAPPVLGQQVTPTTCSVLSDEKGVPLTHPVLCQQRVKELKRHLVLPFIRALRGSSSFDSQRVGPLSGRPCDSRSTSWAFHPPEDSSVPTHMGLGVHANS